MTTSSSDKEIIYAELSDRIKASYADMIVLVVLIFAVTSVFSMFQNVLVEARIAAFIGIFFVYEPLMVSVFGATIGHLVNGLYVRRSSDVSRKVIFPLAIVRYIAKVFLGVISLFTVSSNFEGKAIHDIIVNSVVLKKKK
jgi:uncharacterized RDD family membrane protein YckC